MSKSQSSIWVKVFFIATLCLVAIYLMNGWLLKTEEALEFRVDGTNPGFKVIGVSQQGVDRLFGTSGESTDLDVVGAGDLFGIGGGEFDPLWYKFAVFVELPRSLTDVTVGNRVEIVPLEESLGVKFSDGLITEVCGTQTHRRFKIMAMVECKYTLSMNARIALKLFYYQGKRGKGLLNFNGPFLAGAAATDAHAKGQELFLIDSERRNNHGNLGLEVRVDKSEVYHGEPVIAYDISGRRYHLGNISTHRPGSTQVSTVFNHTNLNFPPAALDCVTVGEVAKSVVFRNIQILIPEKKVQPKTYPTNKLPGVPHIFAQLYSKDAKRPAKLATADAQLTFQKLFKHCNPLTAKSAIRNGLLHNTPGSVAAMLSYLTLFPGDFDFSEIKFYQRKILPKYAAQVLPLIANGAKLNEYGKVTYQKVPKFAKDLAIRFANKSDPHTAALEALAEMSEPWIWWNAIDAMVKAKISIDKFPAKKSLYYGGTMTPEAVTLLAKTLTIECFRYEPVLYFKLMEEGLAIVHNKAVLRSLSRSLKAVSRPILHRELIAGIVTCLNRKYHKIFGLMGSSAEALKPKNTEGKWYKDVKLKKGRNEAIKWLNKVTTD